MFWTTIFAVSAMTISSAYAGCFEDRAGNYTSKTPSTCISTSSLDDALTRSEINETARNILRTGIEMVPFAGTAITRTMDELSRYDDYVPYNTRQVKSELHKYLGEYENQVRIGDKASPQTLYEISEASITYYMDLNRLLEDKRFKEEERNTIRTKMMEIKFLAESMITRLNVDLHNNQSATTKELGVKVTKLEQKILKEVNNLNYEKVMAKLLEIDGKLGDLNSKLKTLESAPQKNEYEIEKVKSEIAETLSARANVGKITTNDIKDYTEFANGLVAIYSLFNAPEAARLSAAVTGISNVSMGMARLSDISSGALQGSALGPYGMIALGTVQLFGSLKSGGGANDAFKAIFKQLKQISLQIKDLSEKMDRQFNRLESSLFQVEKNVISRLGEIDENISDLRELSLFGRDSLLKLNRDLLELSNHVVDTDIRRTIRESYLNNVYRCIGPTYADKRLSKKETKECLDSFYVWVSNDISSTLLTKKRVSGQYEFRGNQEFQINDLSSYFRSWSKDSKISTELANPLLLQDTVDNLSILKSKFRFFNQNLSQHQVYNHVETHVTKIEYLQKKLNDNPEFFVDLKNEHEKVLRSVHEEITSKRDSFENKRALKYHRESLQRFVKQISEELIRRGEYGSSDFKYPMAAKNLNDWAVNEDYKKTIQNLRSLYHKYKSLKYEGDLIDLVRSSKLVLFATHCNPNTQTSGITLPISNDYLKKVLGEELLQRVLLDSANVNLCYNLNLEKNRLLYSAVYMFSGKERENDQKANYNDIRFENEKKIPLPIIIGGGRGGINTTKSNAFYNGDFLTGFSLHLNFRGREILNEKSKILQKLAWYKNTTDYYSLLNINEGNYLHGSYPVSKDALGKHTTIKVSTNNQSHIYETSGTQESQNIRSSMDSKALLQQEILLYRLQISSETIDYIKHMNMEKISESGRILSLAYYFKDPQQFKMSPVLQNNLSEIWGLRSETFLKDLYSNVLNSDSSKASLDFVFKNQQEALAALP